MAGAEGSENEGWTVRRALDWTRGYLERKGDEHALASAQWLLGEACGLSKVQLYVSMDRALSPDELARLHGFVARRAKGEPLQYITGEAAFRHISVKVRPGVLIPRPETEVLVSEALSLLPPARRRTYDDDIVEALAAHADEAMALMEGESGAVTEAFRDVFSEAKGAADAERAAEAGARVLVADVCTGTGCIACSVAYERPDANVIATDLAPEAVALARENVRDLGLSARVGVVEGDLGEAVPKRFWGRLDLVVSNPPYVPTAVLADIPREVADFEPRLALDGGRDGLDLYRRLIAWARTALKPGGGLAVELHETCLEEAAREARDAGYAEVRIVCDLAGRPRVLTARNGEEGESHDGRPERQGER